MHYLKGTLVKTWKYAFAVNIVFSIVSLFAFENPLSIILGALFGCFIGCANFYLLAISVVNSANMGNPERAKKYATSQYFFRYLMLALALFAAIRLPILNIYSAAFGVLSIKFVIYFIQFKESNNEEYIRAENLMSEKFDKKLNDKKDFRYGRRGFSIDEDDDDDYYERRN